MALDNGIASDNKRAFPRQRAGAECTFVLDRMESRATLLDASRGGFKLRFDQAEAAMAAIAPLPRDMIIVDQFAKMRATVMWASGGLAGCRFYQHLSLDDVVRMMTGHFRLELAPLAQPADAAPAS
ncbi:PilZ domain-containing protein [Magnetospirillum sp. 15-1]|uniref:PilZ domain-containing protein n=1 Tax=Magnetospirillum sp. 15-1 TaxID=1979370 RepID=UPI000BBC7A03|nr:PilZ domain-containing protein [Magnetospirillum sp. 15-1]